MDASREDLLKLCREVLAPLIAADGGVLYVVDSGPDEVHLHLAGTCAGCPGASLTREDVIAPAVRSVLPKAKLQVTAGWRIPKGAEKV